MKQHSLLLFISSVFISPALSKVYIVDGQRGAAFNDGLSVERPLRTIAECVTKLSHPGDECQVRAGRYHEVVTVENLQGTHDKPIKITGFGDERPVVDGTEPVIPEGWSYDQKSGICSTKVPKDIIELFYEDDMLTLARWPNALWSDRTAFDNHYWRQAPKSKRGTIIDEGLGEAGIDFTGAMAILNIGSWETFVCEVLEFDGSSSFKYNDTFGKMKFINKQYYLEAKLDLLDVPEEWFYDMNTKTLSLILPAGHKEQGPCPDPSKKNLNGRTIDYAFEIKNSSYVIMSNMSFFASNVLAEENVLGISLDSLDFRFPSSSHRVLKSDALAPNTRIHGDDCSIVNCTFFGADGAAMEYKGKNGLFHNNDFSINDWAGQGLQSATIMAGLIDGEFSQNTLWYNGKAPGVRYTGRGNSNISYNLMAGQCWGRTQSDGASVQISPQGVSGIQVTHNWAFNSPKKGIRFDGDPGGMNGTISHNVVWQIWNDNEIFPKGNRHRILNNVAYEDPNNMDDQCTVCVPPHHWGYPMNNETTVLNNGATKMGSGGGTVHNNFASKTVQKEMVDVYVQDFRPVPGGDFTKGPVTIGAYEVNATEYWIPGRKLYKTSYPIPSNGTRVKRRSDVMCRLGYLADAHHFYLGETAGEVAHAGPKDPAFQYTLFNQDNVFRLPSGLAENKNYFWRVDSQRGGYVYQGDVWQLSFL